MKPRGSPLVARISTTHLAYVGAEKLMNMRATNKAFMAYSK
jgi:hypothetical protein